MFARAKKSGKNPRVLHWNTQGIHFHKPASRQELFCSAAFNPCRVAYTRQYELWALFLPQGPEQKTSCLPRRDLGHPTVKLCFTQLTHKPFHFLSTCNFKLMKRRRLASNHDRILLFYWVVTSALQTCFIEETHKSRQNETLLP